MTTMYYDRDADMSLIRAKKVAILGFGSQGHAHALNLRDSGVQVRVGLAPTSASRRRALEEQLVVSSVADASAWANVIMVLVPDTAQPALFRDAIRPHLESSKTLMFAHGFNVRFGTLDVPSDIDVSMIAPKSPGHRVRELYVEGAGTPALLAVHQDASGSARQVALSYAAALGGFDDDLRAVHVHGDHVHALVDEAVRGFRLLHRQEPVAGEDDLRGDVRLDALRAEGEGVDVAQHLRDRLGGDEAELLALRGVPGDDTVQVLALVDVAEVARRVLRVLAFGPQPAAMGEIGLRHVAGPQRGEPKEILQGVEALPRRQRHGQGPLHFEE